MGQPAGGRPIGIGSTGPDRDHALVLIPGGVVVYVIGRIAKAIAGLRANP